MMNSEYLRKQQKYTRKLHKATAKVKQYDLLASCSPLNDELKNHRLKYYGKIAKYQTKLAQLKLTFKQSRLPCSQAYFEIVLSVTQYAWLHEDTCLEKATETLNKSKNKQEVKRVESTVQQATQQRYSVSHPTLNKYSSNDALMVKFIDLTLAKTKSNRCKNCPAIKKIGACRCESKQRQAS